MAAAWLIATLALVVIAGPPAALAAAAPGQGVAPAGSRQESYRVWQEVRDEEARLRREVLDAGVRLRRAEEEADRLARESAAMATAVAAAREQSDAAERRLANQRQRVNRWLRYLQENGGVSYMDVLMGSADFVDFTGRLEVLSRLIQRNVALLREVKAARAEALSREADLAERQQALTNLATRQREAAELLTRRRAEKAAALVRARSVLGERAADLAELDRRWAAALPALAYFLAHIQDLPWDQVEPDSIKYNLLAGTARAEVREAALNRALFSADPRLSALRIRLLPGRLDLLGGDAGGFTLTGPISVSGGRASFVPAALEFEGVPVGAETLQELASAYVLSLDFSRSAGFLLLHGLEVTEGSLILHLGR